MKYKLLFILFVFYSICQEQIDNNNDENICNNIDYINNNCWSAELKSSDNLCCLIKETNNINFLETITQCSIISSENLNIYSNPKLKVMIREINGYFSQVNNTNSLDNTNDNNDNYYKLEAYCEKGNLTYESNDFKFTDEEIKILKSNSHCIYYYSNSYEINSIKKEECLNANLLESSKKQGIECGYYNFEINYDDGMKKKIQTCYLLDIENLKSKELDNFIINEMDNFVNTYSEYKSISYEVEIFGSDGTSFKLNRIFNNIGEEQIVNKNNFENSETEKIKEEDEVKVNAEVNCEEIVPFSEKDCTSFLSVPLNNYCCFKSEKINNDYNNECLIISSNEYKIMSDLKHKAMMKELILFGRKNENLFNFVYEQKIVCRYESSKIDINKFGNEDDINILNSNNHCLYYFNQTMIKGKHISISKDTCFNADLLEDSKDFNIECGYFDFTLIYKNGVKKSYQTCYLFNPNFLNYKQFDYYTKLNIESIKDKYLAEDENKNKFISFTIDISLSNEISVKYSSLDEQLIINKLPTNNQIKNKNSINENEGYNMDNSKNNILNCFLFLLFLLLQF